MLKTKLDIRTDQFVIDIPNKIFHAQLEIWEEEKNSNFFGSPIYAYKDSFPLCGVKMTKDFGIGDLHPEKNKVNCSDCILILEANPKV